MSKKLTKSQNEISEMSDVIKVLIVVVSVIAIILSFIKVNHPEMFTSYSEGQCYIDTDDNSANPTYAKIHAIEDKGRLIVNYFFVNTGDDTHEFRNREKSEFQHIYGK